MPESRVVVICGSLLLSLLVNCTAQQQLSTVKIRREKGNILDAAKIIGVKVDGQFHDLTSLTPPSPFMARPDWIDHTQVIVENESGKTIIAGHLQVNCPGLHQEPTQAFAPFDILVQGQIPQRFLRSLDDSDSADQPGQRPAISIPPHGKLTFTVKTDSAGLRSRVQPNPSPAACEFGLRDFHFADGSMWKPREFFKTDSQNEHGYIKVSPDEFKAMAQHK